ncbi:hypothetical protein EVAR_21655_1 [Eumeta japonica]|uniref:Uncharacterized protein n=1 Tax=Eumeta variegata TaxID=151549 RepID=A0A4C1VHI8_EUMVA|nr:hypothetical protein EVAR_21655_1 [Eumeta japonica]
MVHFRRTSTWSRVDLEAYRCERRSVYPHYCGVYVAPVEHSMHGKSCIGSNSTIAPIVESARARPAGCPLALIDRLDIVVNVGVHLGDSSVESGYSSFSKLLIVCSQITPGAGDRWQGGSITRLDEPADEFNFHLSV